MRASLLVSACVVYLSGCSSFFYPPSSQPPPPNVSVRVEFQPRRSVLVTSDRGDSTWHDVRVLQGRLVSISGDTARIRIDRSIFSRIPRNATALVVRDATARMAAQNQARVVAIGVVAGLALVVGVGAWLVSQGLGTVPG